MFIALQRTLALLIIMASLLLNGALFAQEVREPVSTNSEWEKPYPPFRIAGNLYYVGTYELACYLVTTPEGNILINTGLASSDSIILQNIRSLGFRPADTRILLTNQAHFDHLGAMASIKKSTGAQLWVDEKDGPVVADGGRSDFAFGGNNSLFAPVTPDRLLRDGDTIALGGTQIVMLHHPGHTKGSCSYLLTVKDEQDSYRVLIANLPTIVTDKPLDKIPAYPEISADLAHTLASMKQIKFDIWLAAHASQFGMHKKHKPGDRYDPSAFFDRAGYDHALTRLQEQYEKKIKQ